MSTLLYNIAGTVVFNLIQLVSGCILAVVVLMIFKGKAASFDNRQRSRILVAIIFSLCGILLPLGIYGVIPLIAAILAVGFKGYAACALLVSNVAFNMLVPCNDPAFVWRTGFRQVVFAFIAGLLAGILLTLINNSEDKIIRLKHMPVFPDSPSKFKLAIGFADDSVKKLGLFLVVGSAADTVFRRFILSAVVNAFYSNPVTRAIPDFFGGQDVSNPFFLITFSIVYMLMNLVILSGLISILKLKGLILYFGYYFALAVILAIPAFI